MDKFAKVALASVFMALFAIPATALEMRPILTLDVARKIVEACIAKAQQQGWKMHVAVLDIGGNLKAFARMDDAQLLSEEVAIGKPIRPLRCLARRAKSPISPTATRTGARVGSRFSRTSP